MKIEDVLALVCSIATFLFLFFSIAVFLRFWWLCVVSWGLFGVACGWIPTAFVGVLVLFAWDEVKLGWTR
jgi:hypothetical protein